MAQFSVTQIIENIRQAKKELIATKMFLDEAQKLDSYIEHIKQPLLIMVMGEFSTGKSTFINALVGKQIAVVDALPTTAVITKLCHGDAEKVMVYYRDGSNHEYEPDEWGRLTAESDEEANALHEKIDYVERAVPISVLKDMTVIDSPGLNALKDAHAEATKRFVEQSDTVLWMISSEKAATDTEYQGIEKLSPRLKPIVIVNKMDLLDEEEGDDPESFLQSIRGKLKDKVQAVIGISAENAFQGKIEEDEALLAASNFSAFDDIVQDVILPNRDAYKVNSLIDELNEWLYGVMLKVQAAEEENKPNEEKDYNKYVENRSVLSRVEDALALIAQPLKDYCQESTNNASALALLGILHEFGLVLVQQESQAMSAYEKAAVKNNIFAQYVLAKKYLKQNAQDKAMYWLNKAIKAEYPLTPQLLAEIERKKAEAEQATKQTQIVERRTEPIRQETQRTGNETRDAESKVKMYRMIAVAGVCLAVLTGAFALLGGGNDKGNGASNSSMTESNAVVASGDSKSDAKKISESASSKNNQPIEQKSAADARTINNRNNNQQASSKSNTGSSTPAVVPTGKHWISDAQGVYLWNPEPTDGETISWNGGYVTDGNYKFADGKGVVTWYRYGKIIQVDEGGFSHGRHHGKFVHKFPSGNVIYSNWDHGRELD